MSKFISETCLSRKPFGLATNFNDFKDTGVKCICKGKKEKFVDPNAFTDKNNVLGKWKVCMAYADGGAHNPDADGKIKGVRNYFVLEPNAICLETYLVVNYFDTKTDANNFISYMNTKFFKFLLSLRTMKNASQKSFSWVPDVEDYSAPWTDEQLYEKFNLNDNEIEYIELKIKKQD